MLPLAGEYRYLRVRIRNDLSRREAIALIGHELQHALEIADAIEVRDTTSLIKLTSESDTPAKANTPTIRMRRRVWVGWSGASWRAERPSQPAARGNAASVASCDRVRSVTCRYVTVAASEYKLPYRDRDRYFSRLPFALPQP